MLLMNLFFYSSARYAANIFMHPRRTIFLLTAGPKGTFKYASALIIIYSRERTRGKLVLGIKLGIDHAGRHFHFN